MAYFQSQGFHYNALPHLVKYFFVRIFCAIFSPDLHLSSWPLDPLTSSFCLSLPHHHGAGNPIMPRAFAGGESYPKKAEKDGYR